MHVGLMLSRLRLCADSGDSAEIKAQPQAQRMPHCRSTVMRVIGSSLRLC